MAIDNIIGITKLAKQNPSLHSGDICEIGGELFRFDGYTMAGFGAFSRIKIRKLKENKDGFMELDESRDDEIKNAIKSHMNDRKALIK